MHPSSLICAATVMFAVPATAFAQQAIDPALAADITVTGTSLDTPDSARAYSQIEIEAPDETASGRLEDALRSVAGLQQFRRSDARSANATSQGATLRGLGGNASSRALLVLDGVPQSDPFGGWVTWHAYAPNRLETVRVTRGGGSGAYGSGALSGTIEMESIGRRETRRLASAFAGSRNSVEASALLGGRMGLGLGFVSASYARGDGFVPIAKSQRGSVDRAAPYEQASLSARGVIPIGRDTELQASVLGFIDRRERGTALSDNGGEGADASVRIVRESGYKRWDFEALAYVQVRRFFSRFVAVNAARSMVTPTVDQYNVPSTGMGGKLEMRPWVGQDHQLRLGVDWRRTVGETRELFTYVSGLPTRAREAGGSASTLGGFAEATIDTYGDVMVTASARVDHWRLGQGRLLERTLATSAPFRTEIAPAREGWETTGRIGISWRNRLRMAAYTGWRLPTLNELYRPFRVGADATAANPLLKPERMKGIEAGMERRFTLGEPWLPDVDVTSVNEAEMSRPRLRLAATIFSNRLRDAIGNVTLANGPGVYPGVGFVAAGGAYRQRLNLDAVKSTGVEFDAELSVRMWRLSGSYAYTRARVKASGAALALNGLRPAQVPAHMASVTVSRNGLSATLHHVASQYEDDSNSRSLGKATTLDLMAEWPLGKHFTLALRGENVTNARVEAAISGLGVIERATPRTLWLGMKVK